MEGKRRIGKEDAGIGRKHLDTSEGKRSYYGPPGAG